MDHRAFLQQFLPVTGALRGFLLAATGNLTDADDLLQEVSSALWESFAKYDPTRPFRAWALGIARHKVLKWREGRPRARSLSDDALAVLADSAVEARDETATLRTYLQRCLDGLTRRAREVVRLRYGEALPVADVARRVGKNVPAIEMMLVRIRRALRECVAEAGA